MSGPWQMIAQGLDVPVYIRACQMLGAPVQLHNDGRVLMTTGEAAIVIYVVESAARRVGSAPIDLLMTVYLADKERFIKVMDSIRTVLAIDPSFDVREMVADLLKPPT